MDHFSMESLKGVLPDNLLKLKFMGDFDISDLAGCSANSNYDNGFNSDSDNTNDSDDITTTDSNQEMTNLTNDRCVNNIDNDENIRCKKFVEKVELTKSPKKYKSQYSNVLNNYLVEELEKDLDFYEKISIAFLIYEDQELEYALQRLTVACEDSSKICSLLSDWCLTEPKFWREKLLQALVIVKNFYVLLKLGYNKNDAKTLFHKKNYIPSIRKKIYYFCESLSVEEAKSFIDKVNSDLKIKNNYSDSDIIDCDPKFLELSFLFWSSRKYISLNSKNIDLINLINCLDESKTFFDIKKQLLVINNHIRLPKDANAKKSCPVNQKFENEIENSNHMGDNLPSVENNMEGHDQLASVASVSTVTTASSISTNWSQEFKRCEVFTYYEIIDCNEVGLCIIINQKNFQNRAVNIPSKYLSAEPLPDRDGTEIDVDKIKSTFTSLHYKVFVFDDINHKHLLGCIKTTVEEQFIPRKHSSVFLFILTHGCQGHIYTCDSVAFPIELVKKSLWECKCLIGKPKGVILQACQGNVPQEVIVSDGHENSKSYLQGQCDLFLGLATVEGNVAFRSTSTGTWFIQILCQCIEDLAYTTDFAKIFTRVNDKLSKKRASDATHSHTYGQISECRSSLRLEWYLVPPKFGATISEHDGGTQKQDTASKIS